MKLYTRSRLLLFTLLGLFFGSMLFTSVNAICMNGGNMPDPSIAGGGGLPPIYIYVEGSTDPYLDDDGEFLLSWSFAGDEGNEIWLVDPSGDILFADLGVGVSQHLVTGMANGIYKFYVVVDTLPFVPVPSENTVIVTVQSSQPSTCDLIQDLIDSVTASSDSDWRSPADNRKNAMINKLEECKVLCQSEAWEELTNKLEHDIMPKLTGEKADGKPFKNAWVTDSTLQNTLGLKLTEILNSI